MVIHSHHMGGKDDEYAIIQHRTILTIQWRVTSGDFEEMGRTRSTSSLSGALSFIIYIRSI